MYQETNTPTAPLFTKEQLRPLNDWVFFTVDKEYEDQIITGGLALELDYSYDLKAHVRRFGTVVAAPTGLSDTNLDPIDPGLPAPRPHVSGDMIQLFRKNFELNGMSPHEVDKRWSRADYCSGGHVQKFKKLSDLKLDVKVGDKIYFYPNTICDENRIDLGRYGDKNVFRVRWDQVICVVRKKHIFDLQAISSMAEVRRAISHYEETGRIHRGMTVEDVIIPVAGHVLVRPDMQTWEEVTTPSGLIAQSELKAKPLRGFVVAADPSSGLKYNDHILFLPNSDWLNKIEGETVFVMKDDEIIGKITNKMARLNIEPLGDRVVVEEISTESKTASGLYIPDSAKEKPTKGTIIAAGPTSGLSAGDTVLYGKLSGTAVEIDKKSYIIMRSSDVFGIITEQ